MGKQVRSLYRYGSTRDCTRAMDDFKWCLASRQLAPDAKRDAWIDRRAQWWAERRAGPSSEDVWDTRRCAGRFEGDLTSQLPGRPALAPHAAQARDARPVREKVIVVHVQSRCLFWLRSCVAIRSWDWLVDLDRVVFELRGLVLWTCCETMDAYLGVGPAVAAEDALVEVVELRRSAPSGAECGP